MYTDIALPVVYVYEIAQNPFMLVLSGKRETQVW